MAVIQRFQLTGLLAAILLIVSANVGIASNWKTDASGLFSSGLNWTSGVPGSADVATFDRSNPAIGYTVTFPGSATGAAAPVYTVASLVVKSNTVTFAPGSGANAPSFVATHTTYPNPAIVIGGGPGSKLVSQISMSAPLAYIGEDSGTGELDVSSATVEIGPGDSRGVLIVGDGVPGTLKITGTGKVEVTGDTAYASIGNLYTQAEADVDGPNAKLLVDGIGQFRVGDTDSLGTLKITNGGYVEDASGFVGISTDISYGDPVGKVIVDGNGSVWVNRDSLWIGGAQDTSSSLTLSHGGSTTAVKQVLIGTNSQIDGAGSIIAGSFFNDGTLTPGSQAGSIHSAGIINATTSVFGQAPWGHLLIHLGGTATGTQYDQFLFSGTAVFDGSLDVTLANGFVPSAGESFHILAFGNVTHQFATLNLPVLAAGLSWNVSQLYTSGMISVDGVQIPGDFDGNGIVNAADYVAWRNINGTASDYSLWRTHFGQTVRGTGSAVEIPIPEPSAFLVATVALAALPLHCRRPTSHNRV